MISIVTPVSSLFVDEHNAQIIDKHSDFLECRDHSPAFDYSRHILFHTDLQPAHILTEEDFEYIEKIRRERIDTLQYNIRIPQKFGKKEGEWREQEKRREDGVISQNAGFIHPSLFKKLF